jgi:hypothetical protein
VREKREEAAFDLRNECEVRQVKGEEEEDIFQVQEQPVNEENNNSRDSCGRCSGCCSCLLERPSSTSSQGNVQVDATQRKSIGSMGRVLEREGRKVNVTLQRKWEEKRSNLHEKGMREENSNVKR